MSIRVMSQIWDTDLPPVPKFILLALADWADDEGGHIYPSQTTVARKTGYSRKCIGDHLRDLEAVGILEVVREATKRTPKEYRIVRWHPGLHQDSPKDSSRVEPGLHQMAPTVTSGSAQMAPTVTQSIKTSLSTKEPSRSVQPASSSMLELAFTDFWNTYPRRTGKGAAKKALASAMKRAKLGDILLGARLFRDDPNREDAFTPHPATWLNQDRWEDDPLPRREKKPEYERLLKKAVQIREGREDAGGAGPRALGAVEHGLPDGSPG